MKSVGRTFELNRLVAGGGTRNDTRQLRKLGTRSDTRQLRKVSKKRYRELENDFWIAFIGIGIHTFRVRERLRQRTS